MGCRPHARAESGRHMARSADGLVMPSAADAARLAASHGRCERRPPIPLVKGAARGGCVSPHLVPLRERG